MNHSAVHRIRLKGPWEILSPVTENREFERQSMPQSWRALFGDVAGKASFRRNFHTPSGLEKGDRVLVHIPEGVGTLSEFSINETPLSSSSVLPLKFDVTQHLQGFNQLAFSLDFDPAAQPDLPGGLWETVFIEIHPRSMKDTT